MSSPSSSIFTRIIDGEIPATILHRDGRCVAFRDIDPQAPHHILIVPCQPISRLATAGEDDETLLGHLLLTAAKVARQSGLEAKGYRLVINNGPDGGETVPHLHVHLLGGRAMQWPPG